MLELPGLGNEVYYPPKEDKEFSFIAKIPIKEALASFKGHKDQLSSPLLMATRLLKLPRYLPSDLQGISKKCDCFIFEDQVIKKPGVKVPQTFFVSMHKITSFQHFVDNILPTLNQPFVLILASEDATFPSGDKDSRFSCMKSSDNQNRYKKLMKNPYLKACFVENLDRIAPKLYPLPLGVLPYDAPITPVKKVCFNQRSLKALCIHRNRLGLQFDIRRRVTNIARIGWKDLVIQKDSCSREEFLGLLSRHCFCLCVHGGGIDPSPKAWEALAMGCIPIIERSTLDKAYSRFPVVYVDKWEEETLSLRKLKRWLKKLRPFYEDPKKRAEVIHRLSMDYWWKEILSKLS